MKIFGKDIPFGAKAKAALAVLVFAGCAFFAYQYYEEGQE